MKPRLLSQVILWTGLGIGCHGANTAQELTVQPVAVKESAVQLAAGQKSAVQSETLDRPTALAILQKHFELKPPREFPMQIVHTVVTGPGWEREQNEAGLQVMRRLEENGLLRSKGVDPNRGRNVFGPITWYYFEFVESQACGKPAPIPDDPFRVRQPIAIRIFTEVTGISQQFGSTVVEADLGDHPTACYQAWNAVITRLRLDTGDHSPLRGWPQQFKPEHQQFEFRKYDDRWRFVRKLGSF
jgi:hypothetical protein